MQNYRKEKRILKKQLNKNQSSGYKSFSIEKFISTFAPGSLSFYMYISSFFILGFLVLFFPFRLFINENSVDFILFFLTSSSLLYHICFKDQMMMSLYFGMNGFKINKDLILKNILNEKYIFSYLSILKNEDINPNFTKKYNIYYYYPVLIFLNISIAYILIFNSYFITDNLSAFLSWIENNLGKVTTLLGITISILIHIKTKNLSFLIIGIFLSLFIGGFIGVMDVFSDAGSCGWPDEDFN